jgi:putative transposase
LDTSFCLDALNEAFDLYGTPEIFNTDQGCQFTSHIFTEALLDKKIAILMDSVGRTMDNIMIERFFRTLKYEDIYLKRYSSIKELKFGVAKYMTFYNHKRRHSSLKKQTPYSVYCGKTFCLN